VMPLRQAPAARCGMSQSLLQARENFEWMCRSAWNIAVSHSPLTRPPGGRRPRSILPRQIRAPARTSGDTGPHRPVRPARRGHGRPRPPGGNYADLHRSPQTRDRPKAWRGNGKGATGHARQWNRDKTAMDSAGWRGTSRAVRTRRPGPGPGRPAVAPVVAVHQAGRQNCIWVGRIWPGRSSGPHMSTSQSISYTCVKHMHGGRAQRFTSGCVKTVERKRLVERSRGAHSTSGCLRRVHRRTCRVVAPRDGAEA